MRVGILAFSERGLALGRKLAGQLGGGAVASRCEAGGLGAWTRDHFAACDALVFVGSAGIALRAVAPHVKSKLTDPAVVVIDELGTYSIALLSGHSGGANELAARIGKIAGAIPVITTATDRAGVFAVDVWAKAQGLKIANPERVKQVSSRLLAGQAVKLKSQVPLQGQLPSGIELTDGASDILVSFRPSNDAGALHLVPPMLTLGIGCRRGIAAEIIQSAFSALLDEARCHPAAVARVCSIDLKANEPGILAFCRRRALPYYTFSAAELAAVPGEFSGSAFVQSVAGVDNVCERSAVLGCGAPGGLLAEKSAEGGVTMALAVGAYALRFAGGEDL